MIFKLVLTICLVFVSLYSFALWRFSARSLMLLIGYLLGIVLIWFQDVSNDIAMFFGIGRGLDFFSIILFVTGINILISIAHRIDLLNKNVTKLAREVTILHVKSLNNIKLL